MNGEGGCDPLFIGGGGAWRHVSDPCDLHQASLEQTVIESRVEIMGVHGGMHKPPLNQGLRSWVCMEACTKAVGASWSSRGAIDRWDLSPPSRRLAHYHSVWLATLGM